MKIEDKIKFWEKRAKEDFKFAEDLFNSRKFLWCLFITHLAVEKAIKARVLEVTQKEPPHIHDLVQLANIAKISLDKEQEKELEIISDFNIEARYDDYKEGLKKKANKNYTKNYLEKGKEFLRWFLKKN